MSEHQLVKVKRLLLNKQLSDSDIALCCGVTWQTVQSMKRQIKEEAAAKRLNVG